MIDAFDIAESAASLSLMVESLHAAGVPTDCTSAGPHDPHDHAGPDGHWPDA